MYIRDFKQTKDLNFIIKETFYLMRAFEYFFIILMVYYSY